ncbi:MAG: response regulator [Bacteroidetes bacterium]|nr:response regulator [Bacteroidota bacterium]
MEQENPYILLVDDSPLVSERLTGMLLESGLTLPLAHASHYEQAMDIMKVQMPAIAVVDINLPGRSGLDLLQTIRAAGEMVTVIMMTNQSGDYYRKKAEDQGADYFLDKSIDFEALPELLKRLTTPWTQ